MLPNLTNPFQVIKDRTTNEQPLPINLSIPDFDSSLQHAPINLRKISCMIMQTVKKVLT